VVVFFTADVVAAVVTDVVACTFTCANIAMLDVRAKQRAENLINCDFIVFNLINND